MRGRAVGALAAVLALGGAGQASAAPKAPKAEKAAKAQSGTVKGYVLELSHGDIVVDVAGDRGAHSGDEVELWRPLKLRHPVTGKIITDRFRIGTLKLTQVRDKLSLAKPEGTLERKPQPGDVVILRRAPAPAPAPAPGPGTISVRPAAPAPSSAAQGQPLDPEAAEVTRIFESLRGSDPTTRIIRYEDYVRKHPHSRFAVVLYEEAQQLRKLLALENTSRSPAAPRPTLGGFKPPEAALAHLPLSFGVEVAGPATGAVFHSRNEGEVAYDSTPMSKAGNGYYTITIPADRVSAPELQYFIEATNAAGEAIPVVGDADTPNNVTVHAIPTPKPPKRHEANVTILSDYADYNNWKHNDYAWQTEGSVGFRLGDVGVRAVRTGFGVYRGVGGSLHDLDVLHKSARKVGLTYGYIEGEFGISSFTSIIARGVIGLEDQGVTGGAQALVRIGNDKKTNLMIGGEVLGGVGLRGITELDLNTFQKVPIMFRTEVTNQPAGFAQHDESKLRPAVPGTAPADISQSQANVGVRAIAQVGYRVLPELVVAARGSYQGRTINHAGPGFGGAVSYTW